MGERPPILYLAWQDTATTRRWFPIGRLRRLPDGLYEFVYIRGYEDAQQRAGMQPLVGFPDIHGHYLSEALFPHFKNRLMSPSREEYATYLERLGLKDAPHEPLAILARSGGHRKTDSFAVFEAPVAIEERQGDRRYSIRFFINGTRHVQPEVKPETLQGRENKRLFLMWDWQNQHDPEAIMIRTEDSQLLGWVPRYYCADILALMKRNEPVEVIVERVNQPTTPAWLLILCRLTARWPDGFEALASSQYAPLADAENASKAHAL